jgi:general secretion pathway protein F
MAVFAYRAVTGAGAPANGIVDAASEHAAWTLLRERGLYPTRLDTADAAAVPPRGVRAGQRAVVVRQVAVLLGGGVSLADALAIVGDTAPRPLAAALARVAEAVREGAPLADACRRDGVLLDASECAVVAAGEASGTLAATLRDVASDLERRAARRQTLRRTLTYPAILVAVAGVVLIATSVLVLPEIASLFADHPSALPLPTRVLLGADAVLARVWWLVAAAVVGVGAAAWRWGGHPAVRRRLDDAILSAPVLGPIVREANVARFAHAAARMLRAGLPLDVAVEDAAAAVPNRPLREELLTVRRAIVEGRPLRAALADTQAASPALLGLIGTGEETGGLADALREVGAMHDASVDERIRTAFALLEPALIMSLALLVLSLVWAILVPFLLYDPLGGP